MYIPLSTLESLYVYIHTYPSRMMSFALLQNLAFTLKWNRIILHKSPKINNMKRLKTSAVRYSPSMLPLDLRKVIFSEIPFDNC